MNRSLSTQTTAFTLAAFVTLTLMASINQLASSPVAAETMARADSGTVQVVVVTGKRLANG